MDQTFTTPHEQVAPSRPDPEINYPSGRAPTDLSGISIAALVAGAAPLNHIAALNAWLRAKAAQKLEDGTSARIEQDRWARVCARHGGWTPPHHTEPTVAETTAHALPATRAAIASLMARKGGAA